MSSKSEKVVVQKVKPYPIPTSVEQEGKKFAGEILKLTLKGFIIDMKHSVVKVGEDCLVQFEVPVLKDIIRSKCKIIKTYDHVSVVAGEGTKRMAEMHFLALQDDYKTRIKKFLTAIGQTQRES